MYKNGFKCNQCGTVVADKDGTPRDEVQVRDYMLSKYLFCPECQNPVCMLKAVDVPEDMTGMQGNWNDLKKEGE